MNREEENKAIGAAAVIAAGLIGIVIIVVVGVILLFSWHDINYYVSCHINYCHF